MPGEIQIQYLERPGIDTKKWDKCIDQSPDGRIYAFSWYLDKMAENWDALVLGDYDVVMPLTWKKKWGIHYLTQPFLTAQLGVFGKEMDGGTMESFLNAIPRKFRYWDIYLNPGNLFHLSNFSIYERVNCILPLNRPYDEISQRYNENVRRNIKKSVQAGCTVQKGFDQEKVIFLALKQMGTVNREIRDNIERFRELFRMLKEKNMATTYGIASANGEILASSAFIKTSNRAYYILVGNHPDGKSIGTSHALIDAFIRDHSGTQLTLDFEGSDIPNLAAFYSSFGAIKENYGAIKLNRLPFLLKLFKK